LLPPERHFRLPDFAIFLKRAHSQEWLCYWELPTCR